MDNEKVLNFMSEIENIFDCSSAFFVRLISSMNDVLTDYCAMGIMETIVDIE